MVRTDGLDPQTAVLHRFGEVTAQWGPWFVGDPTVLVQKFSKGCSEAGLDDRVFGGQDSASRIGAVSDQLACEVVVMIGHRGDRHADKSGAVHESDRQNLRPDDRLAESLPSSWQLDGDELRISQAYGPLDAMFHGGFSKDPIRAQIRRPTSPTRSAAAGPLDPAGAPGRG